MCSHVSIIRQTEDGPSSYGWLGCDLDCGCSNSSLNYSGIIRLLSIDRTNGYEHSYRSLANDKAVVILKTSEYTKARRYGSEKYV